MKKGWEIKTLDQISSNLDSRRVPITKSVRESGKYPYYGASGVVDYVADYIFDGDTLLVSEDGANLVARSSPIAFPASGKYWVNNHAHILKFESLTTQRFVELYLEGIPLDSYITGAAQPKLNQKALNSIPIPIPPLDEQQRIVRLLDEAFEGIAIAKANTEQNLQNARAIFESHLQAVFTQRGAGWVEKRLEEVSNILNGYAFNSSDFLSQKGVKCIKITNVGVKEFISNSDSYLPDNFASEYEKASVKKGSIVFALTRSIISDGLKVAIVPEEYNGALLNQRVAAIIANQNFLNGAFLYSYLSTQSVVNYVKGRVNTLMQPNLSISDLRLMPIPIPTYRDQIRITQQLDALREETQRLTRIYEQKLAALVALKKSLLHQAFNGEL